MLVSVGGKFCDCHKRSFIVNADSSHLGGWIDLTIQRKKNSRTKLFLGVLCLGKNSELFHKKIQKEILNELMSE